MRRSYVRKREYNVASKFCGHCMDMPHRRPKRGVCLCGLPYEAEDLEAVKQLARERRFQP